MGQHSGDASMNIGATIDRRLPDLDAGYIRDRIEWTWRQDTDLQLQVGCARSRAVTWLLSVSGREREQEESNCRLCL
jgi:hypothetical protein